MAYTVNKLAKLSGVSARTLHFYDEIGLLKPAYVGENHYRYYEDEQLLMLQQILFYRELGVPLSEIQTIISSDDFDKIEALLSHKNLLVNGLERTAQLIETIDKTISHLRGKAKMKSEELYYGFDSALQKEHEKQLVETGILTQEFIDECNKKIADWTPEEKNDFIHDIERIMTALVDALIQGLKPESHAVQILMSEHYEWIKRTWIPTQKSYLELITLYQSPDFRGFYDQRHPELLDFMVKSMKHFADHQFPSA